jgi:hypothetical protein
MFIQGIIQPTNGNEYFLDRDGQLFRYILQYYRNDGKIYLPNSNQTISREELLAELDYFQIPTNSLFNERGHTSTQPLNPFQIKTEDLNEGTQSTQTSTGPMRPVSSTINLPSLINAFDKVISEMKRLQTSAIQIRFGNGYVVVEPNKSSYEELFRPFEKAGLVMIRQSGSTIKRNFFLKYHEITWDQNEFNNEVIILLMNRKNRGYF